MTIEIQQYKSCTILKNNNDYQILWSRGKEVLNFPISQELVERVPTSEKDSLEVMFYCEHHRWPQKDELEIGGAMGPEVRYPIIKELMDRAFESSRGAYEVMIYAETGSWPL